MQAVDLGVEALADEAALAHGERRLVHDGLGDARSDVRERVKLLRKLAEPARGEVRELLAHGGDARHMPWNPGRMAQAGFDYIACGHIHKPGILIPDKMAYAGALEPTDETQLGPHGYIRGTVDEHGTRIQFVPFARYEYEDLVLNVTEDLTQYALETKLKLELALREDGKIRKIIRLKLVGHRAAELEFSPKRLLDCGRVISVEDETRPAYDLEQMKKTYGASLISAYIEAFETKTDAQSQKALDYGLEALLAARRNG